MESKKRRVIQPNDSGVWELTDHILDFDILWITFSPEIPIQQVNMIMQLLSTNITSSGDTCKTCGGMMKQSGTCYTCMTCGETSGCG